LGRCQGADIDSLGDYFEQQLAGAGEETFALALLKREKVELSGAAGLVGGSGGGVHAAERVGIQ
jgi:hypothetical protein